MGMCLDQGDDHAWLGKAAAAVHAAIRLKEFPERCRMDKDVKECSVWGLDCFTRKLLYDCLELCPELMALETTEEDIRSGFIERHLLSALNALGEEGWYGVECVQTFLGSQGLMQEHVWRHGSG